MPVKKAVEIAYNAKMQRPSVCNAMETLLVHEKMASKFIPAVGQRLLTGGCEVRADQKTRRFLPWAKSARQEDYGHEYLPAVLPLIILSLLFLQSQMRRLSKKPGN